MSHLLQELDRFSAKGNIAGLSEHFKTKFGVIVKSEDDLYQFKYHQLEAKFAEPVTGECRGVILRCADFGEAGVEFHFVSRPFDKFFNQHQGRSPVHKEADLIRMLPNTRLFEKADGTCIQLWFDNTKKGWRVSTLGAITPSQVQEQDYTFTELFWETAKPLAANVDVLSTFDTYIFELCCDENRIVTRYEHNQIVLLGARSRATGEYRSLDHMQDIVDLVPALRMPAQVDPSAYGICNLATLKEYVESQTTLPGQKNPEGYVLYHRDGPDTGYYPVAKLKNSAYLALHHASGDEANSMNKVLAAVINGKIDDIHGELSDRLQKYAEYAVERATDYVQAAYLAHTHLATEGGYENAKAFAMTVKDPGIPKEIRSFFFMNKAKYLGADGGEDFSEDMPFAFAAWITAHYEKLDFKMPTA